MYNDLEPPVNQGAVEGAFDVEDDVAVFQQGGDVEPFELAVGYGGDDGVELLVGQFVDDTDAVLPLDDLRDGPGVIDGDVEVVLLERTVDVDDLGVAHVGAILLEGESQDQDVGVEDLDALLEHQLDGLRGDIFAHAVVDAAAGEDDLGVVAVALGALGEVVGVHADAVAADEARAEGEEVPLGARGFQDVQGVDAHLVEDLAELVDEGDVDVALAVLDDLGGLGDLDGGGEVGAGGDDGGIDFVDILTNGRGGSGSDLADVLDGVLLVAGVDALGGVAREEAFVELEPRDLFDDGDALVFGHAGIDGGLIDDDVALADHLAHGGAGAVQGAQVGVVVGIDGGGDGDDVEVAVDDVLEPGGAAEAVVRDGILQQVVGDFEGGVVAGHQRIHAPLVHVEAHGRELRGEEPGQGQAHVAEADDADFGVFHCMGNLQICFVPIDSFIQPSMEIIFGIIS